MATGCCLARAGTLYARRRMPPTVEPDAAPGATPGRAGAEQPVDDPRGAHRARAVPLGPLRRAIRESGLTLITAGIVVLLFVAYQLWGTGFAERASQRQLRRAFESQVVQPPAPTTTSTSTSTTTAPSATTVAPATVPAPAAPSGEAVAHLVIPKIGVDKYIVEGVGIEDLRKGPGHYPSTPLPGEAGNAAIAGHRTTYGAPFYRLNELASGDDVFVTTRAGKFHYVVASSSVVKPSEVSVLDPSPDNRLTLTTCNPRYSAATRLVVVSRLVDDPAPPPPPPVTGSPSAAKPQAAPAKVTLGSGQRDAWPPTIAYGAAFVLLWILLRVLGATRRRGRRWVPFALGIPLCAVPLWFLFENVIRLLPANI